jgi:hypothetical protein
MYIKNVPMYTSIIRVLSISLYYLTKEFKFLINFFYLSHSVIFNLITMQIKVLIKIKKTNWKYLWTLKYQWKFKLYII